MFTARCMRSWSGWISTMLVLVVDDDRDCCESRALVLADLGANVRAADSGTDALLLVSRQRPQLILTDLTMPGMSGIDLLHELRRDHGSARLPVIAVSALVPADARTFDGYLGSQW